LARTALDAVLLGGCFEPKEAHLWTAIPGSPSPVLRLHRSDPGNPKQYGISAVLANNEALLPAMVNGSQMHGLRAMWRHEEASDYTSPPMRALGNLAGAHPEVA